MQKWQQNFRGCRQEKNSQAVDCCVEMMVEQFFAMGADHARSKFDSTCQLFFQKFEAFSRLRRCQGEEEEEGIVRTNKSKAKPVSSWRCQCQAGAMKALQRVVWSLIFLVFGVHLVNAEEQGNQAQIMSEKDPYPTPQVDFRWRINLCEIYQNYEWKWDVRVLCVEQKKQRGNSQGKDPRTFDGNSQGGDPWYT